MSLHRHATLRPSGIQAQSISVFIYDLPKGLGGGKKVNRMKRRFFKPLSVFGIVQVQSQARIAPAGPAVSAETYPE